MTVAMHNYDDDTYDTTFITIFYTAFGIKLLISEYPRIYGPTNHQCLEQKNIWWELLFVSFFWKISKK